MTEENTDNGDVTKEELQKRKLDWKRISTILEDEKFFNDDHIDSYNTEFHQYIEDNSPVPDPEKDPMYVFVLKPELKKIMAILNGK